LQGSARRFVGLFVDAKELRLAGMRTREVEPAAGFFSAYQVHPQLHEIFQIQVLLPQDGTQRVERPHSLHLGVAVGRPARSSFGKTRPDDQSEADVADQKIRPLCLSRGNASSSK